jgi:hypothetical protein
MPAAGKLLRLVRTAAVLVAGFAAIYVAVTLPRGEAREARLRLTSAHGTLSHTNSRDGSAILTAGDLKPGATATGTVTLRNTGSLPGSLTLSKSGLSNTPSGAQLSSKLELTIQDVTSAQSPSLVYSGALASMGTIALGHLGAGESRTYGFSVSFPGGAFSPSSTDNLYQGAATSVQYDWTLEDSGGAGQVPPAERPPAPGSPRNAEPDSEIDKIAKRVSRRKLRKFSGRATDDVRVKKVEIALVRVGKKIRGAGRRRKMRCYWLKSSRAKFKLVRERSRTCRKRRWLPASGSSKWRFKLRKRLPRGRYVLYSRATDTAGLAEQTFSAADRNMVKLRVR